MPTSSLKDILAIVAGRDPRPQLNVALTNGNRVSLANWHLVDDSIIDSWPDGNPRHLVPFAQIVLIEVPETSGPSR